MISIVIPLYNKEQSIEKTLKGVLNQSFNDFEIVIVDDGSTDRSISIVERFTDPRIRIVCQSNAGVAAARNKGIEKARGEYIAFLDADDNWLPDYLATQYSLTEKYPQCSVFAVRYQFCYDTGNVAPSIINKIRFCGNDGVLTNYFEVATCSHPPLCSSSVMVRSSAIRSIGGFPVGIKSGEDLLTWAKLAVTGDIALSLHPVMAVYNLSGGYDKKNLPPRRQDHGDPVGTVLKEIYKKNSHIHGLKKYISHWHKMRASVAIRYDEPWETIDEVFHSLYYNLFNFRVLPFFILALLPRLIRKKIISRY